MSKKEFLGNTFTWDVRLINFLHSKTASHALHASVTNLIKRTSEGVP